MSHPSHTRVFWSALCLCLGWSVAIMANPPGGPGKLPGGMPTNWGTPYRGFLNVAGINQAVGLPAAPGKSAKALGVCRLPVLLVKFNDTPKEWLVDAVKVKEHFFGPPPAGSGLLPTARQFYQDFTDGKLDLDGEVVDWIPMNQNLNAYLGVQGTLKRSFFNELIPKAAKKVDFTKFNSIALKRGQDNHEVDCLVILLPAEIQQVSGDPSGVQAYRGWTEWTGEFGYDNTKNLDPIAVPERDVKISSYCVCSVFKHLDSYLDPQVRQLFDIGTVSHEVLHMFGMCDLYHTQNVTFGLGGWCLMGYGLYGAQGDPRAPEDTHPMLPCAWTRKQLLLGRELSTVTSDTTGLGLEPAGRHGDFYRIPIPSKDPGDPGDKHYFLVEFRDPNDPATNLGPRKKWNWDKQVPQAGFLIWEADDTVGAWSEFWPYAFDIKGQHLTNPGQNDSVDHPMVRLCPANDPMVLAMPTTATAATDLWTSPEQTFQSKGVRISRFDIANRTFDVSFPKDPGSIATAAPNPPPVQGTSSPPSAPGSALSDPEFLKRLDGEIDRLATIPYSVIDNTPALVHRQELKTLAIAARQPKPAERVTQAATDKPRTATETELHVLATKFGAAKTRGVTGLVDTLNKNKKFYQLFDLKKPAAATPAAASAALESQFKTVLPSLGLPNMVDYQIAKEERSTVQTPDKVQKNTLSITRRPFIQVPAGDAWTSVAALPQNIGAPDVGGRTSLPLEEASQKDSLPVFGADIISYVNADGAVSYVKPAGAEVPTPESVRVPEQNFTAEEVIERCKEKLRHLVPSSTLAGWTATKGVDAATKQTIWRIDIPLKGAPSIKVDVETRKPDKALDGVKILRAE